MSFTRNLADKYGENIIGYCHKKTRLDAAKSASRKVVHKTAEATGELIENQITEQILKAKLCLLWIQEMLKTSLLHQKKARNAKRIKTGIIKWNNAKYRSY